MPDAFCMQHFSEICHKCLFLFLKTLMIYKLNSAGMRKLTRTVALLETVQITIV